VPILPLAIDGSWGCIPKHSRKFGNPSDVFLKVLPPIDTSSIALHDVASLRDTVRATIMTQIAGGEIFRWKQLMVG
jgi:1-acyl-sn-glycerol-3-phosphate acyltransferase